MTDFITQMQPQPQQTARAASKPSLAQPNEVQSRLNLATNNPVTTPTNQPHSAFNLSGGEAATTDTVVSAMPVPTVDANTQRHTGGASGVSRFSDPATQ